MLVGISVHRTEFKEVEYLIVDVYKRQSQSRRNRTGLQTYEINRIFLKLLLHHTSRPEVRLLPR